MSITQILSEYLSGKKTVLREVEERFGIIEKKDSEIGAFLSLRKEKALEEAKAIDAKKDFSKPLSGITGGIKDLICTKGERTTGCSKILENFVPSYDATVIKKLKAAGYVSLGKTNCDEFGNGSSTEYSAYQITKNPQDTSRVPGGSSGGSAAAVASGECTFALGTDTGGSVRQPANFCGIVGIKASYGRVSRYGALPYASSFDTIGPFAESVEDAARVLEVIAGKDPKDSATVDVSVPKYTDYLSSDIAGKKVGIIREYLEAEGLDPAMKKVVENAAEVFRKKGAIVVPISLPLTKYAVPTYFLLAKAEASTNFARYDGIRYGHLAKNTSDLKSVYKKTRSEGFGTEIKRAIMMGTYVLSAGYYDAYYLKAAKVRTLIIQEYASAFREVDVMLTPVSPFLPFQFGEKANDPLQMYLADIFTVTPSIAGICGISVPTEKIGNLKTGVQILGPQLGEEKIINFGWHLEQEFSPS
ncbi:Asp-tRNA(Asn)/Glu-tRNA(Gln) amidotransferase subunit GatA [Candidatus Peregrinibacteria bacterium]|nr:Asp-tRNA(Asn)/Glu-tRNA(Gln) amidotransferase subunit GatA [Candidatus Peregrinibacteria bacterium]